MIICICNNISEHDIKTELDSGQSLEEVIIRLHIGEYCKKCIEYLNTQYADKDQTQVRVLLNSLGS